MKQLFLSLALALGLCSCEVMPVPISVGFMPGNGCYAPPPAIFCQPSFRPVYRPNCYGRPSYYRPPPVYRGCQPRYYRPRCF